MTQPHPKAFAIWFKDLELWNPKSYFEIDWKWPVEVVKPLSTALKRRQEVIDKRKHTFVDAPPITLRFDGSVETREIGNKTGFKGNLFAARTGNVVYSKIDVRNGAIGIVPESLPLVSVTAEFPIYEVKSEVATSEYIQILFKTDTFRKRINSLVSGASGRKRVQPEQLETIKVPLPPFETQRAIVQRWQEGQAEVGRLEAASRLVSEEVSSSSAPQNRQAAFCFVVMGDDDSANSELAEAMLFNLINSKALPLVSEHSLSVLMRDDRSPSTRFAEDPELYLTERLKTTMIGWPTSFYEALGKTPLTRLHATARTLLRADGISKENSPKLDEEAGALLDPIYKLAISLKEGHQQFVYSECFLPIAAEVYLRHSDITGEDKLEQRERRAGYWLREFAKWFDRLGAADLPAQPEPAVLWSIFKRQFDQRAGQVFLAMSFRNAGHLTSVKSAVQEAINKFNEQHTVKILGPTRIDEQGGESYSIPERIFKEIDESKLVIADLTDERPNVYLEIGYAKARGIPFILTFQKQTAESNRVHFDLLVNRYIEYTDTLDLRDKLSVELEAFFRQEQ